MLGVTLDVNTLIEATISARGPAAAILGAWEARQLTIIICDEIIVEFQDVLGRPRIQKRYSHLTADRIFAAGQTLRIFGTMTHLAAIPRVVVDDPDDDVILACTVGGTADYIVSRDHHLLGMTAYEGIPILPPEGFLPILRNDLASAAPSQT